MNQDLIQQDTTQDSLAGGNGGFSTTTGYATGATVPWSGTWVAKNKYMDVVQVYSAGEVFLAGANNVATTWNALSPTISTNGSDGGFTSVKVDAGTV
jgi:hypothetical protein